MKSNKGFTFIEVIISLAILSLFILLMTTLLNLTQKISKTSLDYSEYEYAMAHKKIYDLVLDASKISASSNKIYLENQDNNREHILVFNHQKIYKQTKNPGESFASGYSLILENIENFSIKTDKDIIYVDITDRFLKKRTLKILAKDKKKDEKKQNEKEKSMENSNEDKEKPKI